MRTRGKRKEKYKKGVNTNLKLDQSNECEKAKGDHQWIRLSNPDRPPFSRLKEIKRGLAPQSRPIRTPILPHWKMKRQWGRSNSGEPKDILKK